MGSDFGSIRVIIQYHTAYHLLMAIAEYDIEGKEGEFLLLGPENEFSCRLIERGVRHIDVDCRGVRDIPSLFFKRRTLGVTIVGPFIIPYRALRFCREQGISVKSIIRTDEGVGSFSDFWHIYNSVLLASAFKSKARAFLYSVLFQLQKSYARFVLRSRCHFLFQNDGALNECKRKKATFFLEKIANRNELDGHCVFVTQPFLSNNFFGANEYADFVRRVGEKVGGGRELVVKVHRDDHFDYKAHGFLVSSSEALELFELNDSVVIGVGSTALLNAKLLRRCQQVFYVPLPIGHTGMSQFCKDIFSQYLERLPCP